MTVTFNLPIFFHKESKSKKKKLEGLEVANFFHKESKSINKKKKKFIIFLGGGVGGGSVSPLFSQMSPLFPQMPPLFQEPWDIVLSYKISRQNTVVSSCG